MRAVCIGCTLVASFALTTACADLSSGPAIVPSGAAAAAVEQAVGLRLRRSAPADSSALLNLSATYTSATHERSVVVLVFDSSLATSQATGTLPAASLPGTIIVRYRNVLVLYSGRDADERARAIGAALKG
jgi:hypothetical protein